MTACFGDPGSPTYEVYRGVLGKGVFVRLGGHLVGVVEDRERAMSLIRSDVRIRRARERDDPVFHMAA